MVLQQFRASSLVAEFEEFSRKISHYTTPYRNHGRVPLCPEHKTALGHGLIDDPFCGLVESHCADVGSVGPSLQPQHSLGYYPSARYSTVQGKRDFLQDVYSDHEGWSELAQDKLRLKLLQAPVTFRSQIIG